jgi:hypothetical protein
MRAMTSKKEGAPKGPFRILTYALPYWPGQMVCPNWFKLSSLLTDVFLGAPK